AAWNREDAALQALLTQMRGEFGDRGRTRLPGAAVAAGQQPFLAAALEQVLAVSAGTAEAALVAAAVEHRQHQLHEVRPGQACEHAQAGRARLVGLAGLEDVERGREAEQ